MADPPPNKDTPTTSAGETIYTPALLQELHTYLATLLNIAVKPYGFEDDRPLDFAVSAYESRHDLLSWNRYIAFAIEWARPENVKTETIDADAACLVRDMVDELLAAVGPFEHATPGLMLGVARSKVLRARTHVRIRRATKE